MKPAVRFDRTVPPTPYGTWPGPMSLDVPGGAMYVVWTPPMYTDPLLRLCTGLAEPVSGRVEVLGVEPYRLDRRDGQRFRSRLGVALVPDGLISNLSLRMNLIVPLLYSGAAELDEASRRADELFAATELEHWAEARPADVPPDVRKEAALVRAVAGEPELLLLEDPLASLRTARAEFFVELCRRRARTILITVPEESRLLGRTADRVVRWDEHGLQVMSDEVGIG